jgi:hypothetical protein
MVAGGTLLQLFVPFALAIYFAFRRELPGTAFCAFFFFEQFLPVGIYMADSRSQSLQYVTVGDPDKAEHDFYYLFSQAGLLDHDTAIGGFVRILGWIGMLAIVGWLIWRAWPKPARKVTQTASRASSKPPNGFDFGILGSNLETAAKSPFWQWFHLEQTREQNGIRHFQPNGPKFHSLCYLDVASSPTGVMQALTLGIQRNLIQGPDEPFARDIVKSFLNAVFPDQHSEDLDRLIDEIGSEFGGARPVIVGEAAQKARAATISSPSSAYLVFIGRGKRCRLKSGAFELIEENVIESQTNWLSLNVKPAAW